MYSKQRIFYLSLIFSILFTLGVEFSQDTSVAEAQVATALVFPFSPDQTWKYSGGPHPDSGGYVPKKPSVVFSSLDFLAPTSAGTVAEKCINTSRSKAAPVRSKAAIISPFQMDGRVVSRSTAQSNPWVIIEAGGIRIRMNHVAPSTMVGVGTLKRGGIIGNPSTCGDSDAPHIHFVLLDGNNNPREIAGSTISGYLVGTATMSYATGCLIQIYSSICPSPFGANWNPDIKPGEVRISNPSVQIKSIFPGANVTVSFTYTNVGHYPVSVESIGMAARRGSDWTGSNWDFKYQTTYLNPGQSATYSDKKYFLLGIYFMEPVVKFPGKAWGGVQLEKGGFFHYPFRI
ncbi:MAG: hypothetical protein HXX20_05295 [Chloroflexi bacterium]|nr:hypothetical protein [Chloroflexota bacterium]